jgi:formylglycine-generating enzyme required for sulfatase activity
MVAAGLVCIDKYEASVWDSPTGGTQLTTNAQFDAACPDNGQPTLVAPCTSFYARSVEGVAPAANITWFQAQQALTNVGKRLPWNAEWQAAVAGAPDPGVAPGAEDCNVSSAGPDPTGSRDDCASRYGAFDVVGNLWEWMADWDEEAGGCTNWPAGFGSDFACIGRADTQNSTGFPGALIRGGSFADGASAGPFAVNGGVEPSLSSPDIGFRGSR